MGEELKPELDCVSKLDVFSQNRTQFFGLSVNALKIAGGLVIINSGYALLSGKFAQSRAMDKSVRKEALEKVVTEPAKPTSHQLLFELIRTPDPLGPGACRQE